MAKYKICRVRLWRITELDFCDKSKKVLKFTCKNEEQSEKAEKFVEFLCSHGFTATETPYIYETVSRMSYRMILDRLNSFVSVNKWLPLAVPTIRLCDRNSEIELEWDLNVRSFSKSAMVTPKAESDENTVGAGTRGTSVMSIGYWFTSERPDDAYKRLVAYFIKHGFYHSRKFLYSEEKISYDTFIKLIDDFFGKNPDMRGCFREFAISDGNTRKDLAAAIRAGENISDERECDSVRN